MAITIKKKKATVKTVKSKAKMAAEGQPTSEQGQDGPPPPPEVQAQQTAPPAGPVKVDGKAYTVAVVFALLAIVMFIALIALQSLELSFYYQPRPVFLRKVPTSSMSAPAPSTSD